MKMSLLICQILESFRLKAAKILNTVVSKNHAILWELDRPWQMERMLPTRWWWWTWFNVVISIKPNHADDPVSLLHNCRVRAAAWNLISRLQLAAKFVFGFLSMILPASRYLTQNAIQVNQYRPFYTGCLLPVNLYLYIIEKRIYKQGLGF